MKLNLILKARRIALFFTALIGTITLFSCTSDDSNIVEPILQTDPPIVLACDYFSKNPNAVLKDNPNAAIDYIVTCKMSISDNVTVEPGVTIAFDTDAGFWIRETGSFNAIGTASKLITFTGVNKDRGSWGGLFFNANNPKNEMNHTIFEYAGGVAVSGATNQLGGVVIGKNASLKFKNNLVQHCKNWGLNLYYSANDATTVIENNTFNQNEKPLQVSMNFVGLVKGDNKFTNNTSNKAEISCQYAIDKTQTLHKLSVPYLVRGLFNFEIGVEGNLTIEPGTIIEMASEKRIVVRGSLKAVGTAAEKIIIRGETSTPGSWGNIVFERTSSPNNQINHVEISHAGADPQSYHKNKGAVALDRSRLAIDNTHFKDIFSCILYLTGANELTRGTNITSTNVNVAGLPNCE